MRKIILVCAGGMSSSLLAKRIEEAALREGYDVSVNAFSSSLVESVAADADIVLMGPQIRYEMDKITKMVSCPVVAIDMMAYGMMDGKKVLEQVKAVLVDK